MIVRDECHFAHVLHRFEGLADFDADVIGDAIGFLVGARVLEPHDDFRQIYQIF